MKTKHAKFKMAIVILLVLVPMISLVLINGCTKKEEGPKGLNSSSEDQLKAAPRFSVYAPFSGTQWGQATYCDGSTHHTGINGLCCPTDLHAAASTAVKFYGSSNIQSIRVTKVGPSDDGDALCASTPPSGFGWVNEGVKVELYCTTNASSTVVGTVYYGHLRNRISAGVYNNPNGKILGYLGNQDCGCNCYKGIHTHMERSSGGNTVARSCYTSITQGSTEIYYWNTYCAN